jgi:hypothetical protein
MMETVMKRLFIFFTLCILLISGNLSARAALMLDTHVGLSGTTSVFWVLDSIAEAEGEIVEIAADLGFLTGEIGAALRLELGPFGIAFEAIVGYYHHFAAIVPMLGYFMVEGGVEPYLALGKLSIGAGFGYFGGLMFMEFLGYTLSLPAVHHGLASWFTVGFEFDDDFAISIRFRFHHFVQIGDVDLTAEENHPLVDDFIFCLRFIWRVKFTSG